jgi:hypothetical protein
LVWLKGNNPLYRNIRISDDHLQSWRRGELSAIR